MGSRSLARKYHFFKKRNVSLNLSWNFAEWLLIWFIPSKNKHIWLEMADERITGENILFPFRSNIIAPVFFLGFIVLDLSCAARCRQKLFHLTWGVKAVFLWCFRALGTISARTVATGCFQGPFPGCLFPLSEVLMRNTSSTLRCLKSPRGAWKNLVAGCCVSNCNSKLGDLGEFTQTLLD